MYITELPKLLTRPSLYFKNALILIVVLVQCMSTFTDFWAKIGKKMDSVTMATEIIINELSMNYFVLSENKQVQKVSLKPVTRHEKYFTP